MIREICSRFGAVTKALIMTLALAAATGPQARAQQQNDNIGTISGQVIDGQTGAVLDGVGVQVVGSVGLGGTSDANGRFTITKIPAGTVTLQFRRIGYAAKTITAIRLAAGAVVNQDATMSPVTITLAPQIVTSAAERGTVRETLETQKNATAVASYLTSEQIRKSPDGNAADAVQRASGVTLQNNAPLVRGQGDRGTIATLNNSRIPSPDPEKKQVPFDLFPTALIRTITVLKTFTPDQPGDFSGAIVNIQTKDFPSVRTATYSASIGYNSAATGVDMLAAPTSGLEWLGFAGKSRDLPRSVRSAGNFGSRQFSQGEINEMISSFRNVWTPTDVSGAPNSSIGISYGGNDPILGRQFGYIGALTYSQSTDNQADDYRALIDFSTGDSPANEFSGSTGRNSVLWGGLLNLSTFFGDKHLLSLSNTYNRTSDNEARRDVGSDENLGLDNILERTTLSFVERSVRSNQISGQHTLSPVSNLEWSLTNSAVTRREPDRADMVYVSTIDASTGTRNPYTLFAASSDGARRTFADLSEGSWNFTTDYRLQFGDAFVQSNVKFGVLGRYTHRNAEVYQYSLTNLRQLTLEEASQKAESIFDGRYTGENDNVFTINPLGQSGSYEARDFLVAGYAMADYAISDRVRLVGGARVENSNVEVISTNLFGQKQPVTRNFADVLPALALNVALSDAHNLRLSATRTLARPEYRELSPILNRDVLGGQGFRGDTSLVRTLISNFDLRWEWYPNPGELVSVALFSKFHDSPIEKVEVPTSGTSILSFINADGADNYGLEIEVRKELGNVAYALRPFSIFSNLTFMRSEIRLGETNAASATNKDRPLVGQAPYVVNVGLSYTSPSGAISATGLFNRVGKRIDAAGPFPLPDVYEMERNVVDLSLRFPVVSMFDAKVDMKNLLDSPYELRQGDVTRRMYTTGRTFSIGLSWTRE